MSAGNDRHTLPAVESRSFGGRLHNLRRLQRYLRPYAVQTVWLIVAAGAATGASIVVPLVVRHVVDGPVRHGDSEGLLLLGVLALGLGLIEALLIFIRRWVQSSSALGMETAIRHDLYAHLQLLPVSFHDRWQSGQLLSRATSDLSVIRRFLSFGLIFLVVNLATYVTVVGLLLHIYWPLGLLVAVSAVPLFVISKRFTSQYFSAARKVQDQLGDLATQVEESALGVRVIKSFGRRAHMAGRFGDGARRLHDTAVGKARMLATSWSQFDLVPNATLATVLVVGALEVARGALSLGGLVAFVSLQVMLVWPIDALGWIIANGQEAMTAADRIYEVLDTPQSIVDRPGAVAVDPASIIGELRFETVRFGYPDATVDVLHHIDLELRPGETMAIVGVTGCGKTTLVSLVPRLYDVTGGRITIDGRNVRDYRLDTLRRIVGVAFEEPMLFSMSVRENLTLGRPEATDEEIAEALAVAQAEFVHELPWGLATRIGEQGLSLSGGQRQRLALARAVIARPRVLVLDDPLSALDVHTEALVEEALARVLHGTTALLVVHRPSTVALADRVAFLDDGRIAAVGTHSQLLATVPRYRSVLSAASEEVAGR
jgi:ATP-binding cassette, subfamily B, bacterial